MRQARSGAVRCHVWQVTRPGLRQAHTGSIAGQGLAGGARGTLARGSSLLES